MKTPTQSKRIQALNRAYRSGAEDAYYQVADWLGLVDDEDDEPTEEDVKREIMRLLGKKPPAVRHLAADILCLVREQDTDGEALFNHALDQDEWSLAEAAEEGYTADEIASLNLDGAPDPEGA